MEITIRTAKISDAAAIAGLSDQLGYPSDLARMQARLTQIIAHNENCVFVALKEATIVGWIHGFHSLRVESDPFVEIGGLVVHEAFRKHGIGKKLVDQVADWSENYACTSLRVRCNVVRTESHRFYTSIGFVSTKEQKIFTKSVESDHSPSGRG